MAFLRGRKRALVAAPTGAGKTVMAATKVYEWMFESFEVERTLIVAPKLVALEGWPEQLRLWDHLPGMAEEVRVIDFSELGLEHQDEVTDTSPGRKEQTWVAPRGEVFGPAIESRRVLGFRSKRETKKRLLGLPGRIHICSWDSFPWMEEALGKGWPYDCLVLDESSFVKDRMSDRGKAARRAVQKSGKVTHLLELCATPNANSDEPLFAQLDLVEPGCLGASLTEFRDIYCLPESKNWQTGQVYKWKLAPAMRPAFEAIVAQHMVSVPESLGIDVLPVEHWVEMSPGARDQYKVLRASSVLDQPRVTCGSEAVKHLKLRQLASGFLYDDAGETWHLHPAKQERFRQIVEELDGAPALVAFEFDAELDWLRTMLGPQLRDIRETGAKAAWLAGKFQFLALHPKSAGHGVDGLQARSNAIIWTTVPEDRELFDQANGRLKRPGQGQATVMAHMLIAANTVEEDVWTSTLPAKLRNSTRTLLATRGQDSPAVVDSRT